MKPITTDLYQFSSYAKPIDLTFHQYLLIQKEPVLFHTGNIRQASALVPKIKSVLTGIPLKYIFISHFEADECGGLSYILMHFPEALPICSEVTARQLTGFGIVDDILVKKPGDKFSSDDFEFQFLSYPAEMHLWEGLLVMENKRRIFFSSDLMLKFGDAEGQVIDSSWQNEIENIQPMQIPDPERLLQLKESLHQLSPKFIATGHGPCISLK